MPPKKPEIIHIVIVDGIDRFALGIFEVLCRTIYNDLDVVSKFYGHALVAELIQGLVVCVVFGLIVINFFGRSAERDGLAFLVPRDVFTHPLASGTDWNISRAIIAQIISLLAQRCPAICLTSFYKNWIKIDSCVYIGHSKGRHAA